MDEKYYELYEKRYQKAYAAGIKFWGTRPDDSELIDTLTKWVIFNNLKGRKIVEFACGEGAIGQILANLGCYYHGYDISPSAVEKAKKTLKGLRKAKVFQLDIVSNEILEKYDAAIDSMGLHMLVTDEDRKNYLKNMFNCLKTGAPVLFYRESHEENAYSGEVASFEDWKNISNRDYSNVFERTVIQGKKVIEIEIPMLPARAMSVSGYEKELIAIGFKLDSIKVLPESEHMKHAVRIYVHKPLK